MCRRWIRQARFPVAIAGLGLAVALAASGSAAATSATLSGKRFDLQLQIAAPSTFVLRKAPQRVEIHITVYNAGPATSPEKPKGYGLSLYSPVMHVPGQITAYLGLNELTAPASCGAQPGSPRCPLAPLLPHQAESFVFSLKWTHKEAAEFTKLREKYADLEVRIGGVVNQLRCASEESTCKNNRDYGTIVPK
jgi:hypothetical protein